jgi:hypothetical protein
MSVLRRRTVSYPARGAVLALAVSSLAVAAPSKEDVQKADVLFRDAKKLLDSGKVADACPMLAESQRLDPGGGTQLMLALCYEADGKVLTAQKAFEDTIALAKRDKRADREKIAKEHLGVLAPKIPKLVVSVASGAQVEGLEVKRDGVVVQPFGFGTATTLDPGQHSVEATAPGRKRWSTTVTLAADGKTVTVEVPVLASDQPPPVVSSSAPPPPPPKPERNGRFVPGLVVGGAGVVALGVGAFFGYRALSKRQEADDLCPTAVCASPRGPELVDEARSSATVSNVAMIIGVVGVGVGGYLLLTSSSGGQATGTKLPIRASAGASPSGGGFSLAGSFL